MVSSASAASSAVADPAAALSWALSMTSSHRSTAPSPLRSADAAALPAGAGPHAARSARRSAVVTDPSPLMSALAAFVFARTVRRPSVPHQFSVAGGSMVTRGASVGGSRTEIPFPSVTVAFSAKFFTARPLS